MERQMKIYLVLDNICDAFLAALEDKEQAERYIINTRIKGLAKVKELEVEDGLINDKLYVVTRAKNDQFVYCSSNPIKQLDGIQYKLVEVTLMRRIKEQLWLN